MYAFFSRAKWGQRATHSGRDLLKCRRLGVNALQSGDYALCKRCINDPTSRYCLHPLFLDLWNPFAITREKKEKFEENYWFYQGANLNFALCKGRAIIETRRPIVLWYLSILFTYLSINIWHLKLWCLP